MIGYVTIGSNDIARSCAFFDAAFEPLGYKRTFEGGGWAGYGPGGKKEGLEIYIATPANGEGACLGNGSMLAFKASSREAVNCSAPSRQIPACPKKKWWQRCCDQPSPTTKGTDDHQ